MDVEQKARKLFPKAMRLFDIYTCCAIGAVLLSVGIFVAVAYVEIVLPIKELSERLEHRRVAEQLEHRWIAEQAVDCEKLTREETARTDARRDRTKYAPQSELGRDIAKIYDTLEEDIAAAFRESRMRIAGCESSNGG